MSAPGGAAGIKQSLQNSRDGIFSMASSSTLAPSPLSRYRARSNYRTPCAKHPDYNGTYRLFLPLEFALACFLRRFSCED